MRTASLLPYLSVLAACSATQTYAGPRQVLRELYRLHHKEYVSSEVTSPEYHERIKLYRLMFHARDNGKVRRLLAANLTTERGWAISVVMQGQRIEYDRRNESVEYLSEVQYNLIERGIDNPGWYPNGKPAPRAYRGGCVVQYFKTRR